MNTTVVLRLVCLCAISLTLFGMGAGAQEPKKAPEVTVTITRIRGYEYTVMELEGELKGKNARYLALSCDVVIDNQTGDELTVKSNFFSAFDGLGVALLRDGKKVAEQAYIMHQSPNAEARPFVLKKGKNEKEMRIPLRLPPEDWATLTAKAVGELPGSAFKGKLESTAVKIQRVTSFDPPK